MDQTLETLLEKFGDVAKGGDGIVMVVTPHGSSHHVVAIARGEYEPEDVDEVCEQLRAMTLRSVKSPFL